jgi:tetratricopeptide (TPR) repeat protein
MKTIVSAVVVILIYLSVIFPFASYMKNKPFMEKMGYVPKGDVLKLISADQGPLVAAGLVMKVLFYFGSLVDYAGNKVDTQADYPAISRAIHSAVRVDPYNMDAYYFAQATLVWDAGQIQLVNRLLEYGMRYRTWDYYLPFFAGFNYAYFLKDYENAAKYYKLAGDVSGSELYIKLASRYFYESGQSAMAIAYLSAMEKSARNDAIRKNFHTRLVAIKEAHRIELARDRFIKDRRHLPSTVDELIRDGYLTVKPVDPYGGTFYLEPNGAVRSSSKFAFGSPSKDCKQKSN